MKLALLPISIACLPALLCVGCLFPFPACRPKSDWRPQALTAVVELHVSGTDAKKGDWTGHGSAVVIDRRRGVAVTCAHVVRGAARVETLGPAFTCAVLFEDDVRDVACVSVTPDAYGELSLTCERPGVGEPVYEIGYPFHCPETFSSGVVSGDGCEVGESCGATLESCLQHTAPVNPGESGGPLLDARGRVVGLTVAFLDGGQLIGYALPSSSVRAALAEHAWLGE